MSARALLSSLTEKAQAVLHPPAAAPPAQHQAPPGHPPAAGPHYTPSGPPPGHQQQPQQYAAPAAPAAYAPAPEQPGTLSGRHRGIEAITHQFKSFQAYHSTGVSQENRQLQLIVTTQKSVALDIDATARDCKAMSKELYLWGQTQADDIKDVTDRLAYLNFVQGSLSYTLATELDKSRQAWKNVRDAEIQLAPRRTQRGGFQQQIAKFRADGGRTGGIDTKIQELEAQLQKAESDDAPLERELELLKRNAIKESETIKWKSIREYAQKLTLLAGASEQLLSVLPSSPQAQYTGAQKTAAVRAALQKALDGPYIPSNERLPINVGHVPEESETRSFGETHAQELSSIASVTDNGHTPVSATTALPINPAALNNTPTPIPAAPHSAHYHAPSQPPPSTYVPHDVPHDVPHAAVPPSSSPIVASPSSIPPAPTVAETGIPITSGAEGPGPVSGSLAQEKVETRERPSVGYGAGSGDAHPPVYVTPVVAAPEPRHESAAEEKVRLGAASAAAPATLPANDAHQAGLHASTSVRRPETHESAADEKNRLEREERDRLLRSNTKDSTAPPDGPAPPAYDH